MADSKITEIKGLITTADGQVREFSLTEDGAWQQWGNTTEALGTTGPALQAIADKLLEEDHIARSDNPQEEEKCRECEAPLDDGEGWDGFCGSCADRAFEAETADEDEADEL